MRRLRLAGLTFLLMAAGAGTLLVAPRLQAQDTLSAQVLRLLTRINSWTAANSFSDLRVPAASIPVVTTDRLYTDPSHNLYFNGGLVAGSASSLTPHALLSTTHSDTLAASAARGAVLVGNATPAWSRLTVGAAGTFVRSNGTDTTFSTDGSALTSLPAANLTGTLPAISGVNLTSLNASNLGSGTVPLARLSGITTTEISASAAIPYSKLALTGTILNADISASAAIAYSKLALTNSIVTGDVAAGTLLFSDLSLNSCTANQIMKVNAGATAWACAADANSGGSVTSVAMTVPSILAVAGTPITTTGTLAVTLATEAANLVLAGPTTGSAATPTFRALVAADLAASGITPGTYAKATYSAAGIATAGSTQITASTDVTGVLPRANGGTNVAVSAANTLLVGDGTSWTARTLSTCLGLAYSTATGLFSCPAASGSAAVPWTSLYVGTAATNNLIVTPAAFTQATTATVDNPVLAAVKLPLARRGTVAYTSGAIGAGACATAVTSTVTGLLTTSVVNASLNAAPQTEWKKGIYFLAYPSADTINVAVCNGTSGSVTPESATFNWIAFVP